MPKKQQRGSAFLGWAVAQFGARPKAASLEVVLEAEERARVLRRDYDARQAWDRDVGNALYGWRVKDADKRRGKQW